MKFNRKWTIGAVVGACIIAGGALWKASAKPATRYATAAVTVGNLEQTVLAVGRLHAKELVAVGAQVSGQVKRLHVELGQQVKAGDLIDLQAWVASFQRQLHAQRLLHVDVQRLKDVTENVVLRVFIVVDDRQLANACSSQRVHDHRPHGPRAEHSDVLVEQVKRRTSPLAHVCRRVSPHGQRSHYPLVVDCTAACRE